MTDTERRLAAVRADLRELAADALVVNQEHNRRYLTGFTGSAGLVVVSAEAAHLLVDGRYRDQAAHEAPAFTRVDVTSRFHEALAETLAGLGVGRVAFEAEWLTVAELGRWQSSLPALDFLPSSGIVEQLRAVKTADEVAAIRRAAVLADRAMGHVMETIRPGMTEAEVAWSIERFLREAGAEGLAFSPIVGAGENGALPHHHPGDRVIAAGEPIVVDLGARLDGYNSDLTRTFSLGPARDPDYAAVYAVVDGANRAALTGLRPGLTGSAADALAREPIKAAGHGDDFGHSLGHGVGLNVHEGPRLSHVPPESTLEAGNVVTVEPGIYLPGRFGVRIEDLVVLGEHGVEVLSHAPKHAVL